MTNEVEKKFFDAFGIECDQLIHQQFNYAQVPRGLEFFKTREELANAGMIKNSHQHPGTIVFIGVNITTLQSLTAFCLG